MVKFKNGRVKKILEVTNSHVRVVYDCKEEWENFDDYPSKLTSISDLFLGGLDPNGEDIFMSDPGE